MFFFETILMGCGNVKTCLQRAFFRRSTGEMFVAITIPIVSQYVLSLFICGGGMGGWAGDSQILK